MAHATAGGPHRPDVLGLLGNARLQLFHLSGRLDDLDSLIAAAHAMVSTCPADDVENLRIAHGELAECYRLRANHTVSVEDLEASLQHHREAMAITPERHLVHVMYLVNYVTALAGRGADTGSIRHLEEALRLGRTIRRSTGDPERDVHVRVALHTACQSLSLENGDPGLFDESLDHIRAAARIRVIEPERRRDVLARLTAALVDGYGRGTPDGLDAHGPGPLAAEHRRSVPRRRRALLDEAVSTGRRRSGCRRSLVTKAPAISTSPPR